MAGLAALACVVVLVAPSVSADVELLKRHRDLQQMACVLVAMLGGVALDRRRRPSSVGREEAAGLDGHTRAVARAGEERSGAAPVLHNDANL